MALPHIKVCASGHFRSASRFLMSAMGFTCPAPENVLELCVALEGKALKVEKIPFWKRGAQRSHKGGKQSHRVGLFPLGEVFL